MISVTSSSRSKSPRCPDVVVPGLEGIQRRFWSNETSRWPFLQTIFYKGFHYEILQLPAEINEAGMGEAMAVG